MADGDSALSRVNREAARGALRIDAELFELLADAMQYHHDSDGAFDVTVGR